MFHAHQDITASIDRAAGLLADAMTETRDAARGAPSFQSRLLLRRAIVAVERAQDDLFTARNDPWQPPPKPPQLRLLNGS